MNAFITPRSITLASRRRCPQQKAQRHAAPRRERVAMPVTSSLRLIMLLDYWNWKARTPWLVAWTGGRGKGPSACLDGAAVS
jgi:hypothetical protein